jgi:MFS family permease
MTKVLISDILPLEKRGTYIGYAGVAWNIGSSVGGPLGKAQIES